jgi:hypothetical protein
MIEIFRTHIAHQEISKNQCESEVDFPVRLGRSLLYDLNKWKFEEWKEEISDLMELTRKIEKVIINQRSGDRDWEIYESEPVEELAIDVNMKGNEVNERRLDLTLKSNE